jgi:serine/threonine protein kinase
MIVRRIGAGGMGVVYEAFDRERKTKVALKTLPFIDPAALYRFKNEFRSLAEVIHPNLVALYHLYHIVGADEQVFFTMELVHGCNFLDYVRPRGPGSAVTLRSVQTPPQVEYSMETVDFQPTPQSSGQDDTASLVVRPTLIPAAHNDRLRAALLQLAEGVCALHAAGKLHRDIKPSNVLVTPQGRVVILDFGLVTELEEHLAEEATDMGPAGTVAYMSPEQAAGKPLSQASDWYCVGAMLYQVLTGQPPFVGNKYQVLADKQRMEPSLPSELIPGIPDDLRTLCLDLLRLCPTDRITGAEVLRRLGGAPVTPPTTTAPRSSEAAKTPFVGRAAHLGVLTDALESLEQRRPVAVHVQGRSGAGKSFLVQHFHQDIREEGDVVVLSGRCFEQESVPYKALDSLVDSLTRYLKRLPEHEAAILMPRDVPALAKLFPVLRRVKAVADAPGYASLIPDEQELRRRAFGALREMLARLGDRLRLVLVLDDLQWGDEDSVALLTALLRPPDPPVFLLLCCYRSEYVQTSACLRVLIETHAADATLDRRHLSVEALEPAEARALVKDLLGADATESQVESIACESGGSPYFIHELVQHARSGVALAGHSNGTGQITLDEVLCQRVARLPDDSRRLLEIVAVSGRPLRQSDAYRAAGLEGDSPTTLTMLRINHFVRSTGPEEHDEVEAYHDRVRETVVAHLGVETLRDRHHNLATVLESSGHADPETLAVHFQGAANPAKAGHYYAVAADEAAAALAFDRAAKLYRLSLTLRPLDGADGRALRRKLADALANAGRGADAAQEYQTIAGQSAGSEALELLGRAGYQFCASGHIDEGRAALETVLNRLGLSLPSTRNRALLSMLWHRFRLWLRGLKFREQSADQVPADQLARIDITWSVAVGLTMIDTIRGADFQTRNLLLALNAGEPYRLARALSWEATHAAMGGEGSKKRSARLLEEADALAAQIKNPHALGMATMGRGVAAYFHGSWPEARDLCDKAADIFRNQCTGVTWELDTSNAFSFWSMWFLGELAEMTRRFPILVKEAHERGDMLAEANYTTFGGPFVWLAADDPDRAAQALANVMGAWSKQEFHVQHFTTLTARVQIDLYRGDALAAWHFIVGQWPAMSSSFLLQVECVRIFMEHLRARCALGVAANAADPQPLLAAVQKGARSIEREKPAWCKPLAVQLRAGLAAQRGDKTEAARLLGEAVFGFDRFHMNLYAAAARRRLGELLGGAAGRALIEDADRFFAGQNVKNPSRMVALIVPAFGRD